MRSRYTFKMGRAALLNGFKPSEIATIHPHIGLARGSAAGMCVSARARVVHACIMWHILFSYGLALATAMLCPMPCPAQQNFYMMPWGHEKLPNKNFVTAIILSGSGAPLSRNLNVTAKKKCE